MVLDTNDAPHAQGDLVPDRAIGEGLPLDSQVRNLASGGSFASTPRGMRTSLLRSGIGEPRTDLRNRRDHHPREKLHGGDILVVESVRR